MLKLFLKGNSSKDKTLDKHARAVRKVGTFSTEDANVEGDCKEFQT